MERSEKSERSSCDGCIIRTPYATMVAVIMCWVGSGVFCGTMYRYGIEGCGGFSLMVTVLGG